MEKRQYDHRIRQGKSRFACTSPEKGKRTECCKKLQAITISEVRSTQESKEKTALQAKKQWSDPDKKSEIISAMKEGMAASEAYANRGIKVSATKKLNPQKYSDAMKKAWDTRGRPEWHIVNFKCGTCAKDMRWNLPPAKYERFMSIDIHFCSLPCQYLKWRGKFRSPLETRNCLLCSKEITRLKSYFDARSNYRGFYCSQNHQKQFIKQYGLPDSALQKIKEFRATQVFAEKPNKKEQLLMPIISKFGFRYCGNNTYKIEDLNPDFINDEYKIVLEHMGCWWHRCPACYPGRESELARTAVMSYRKSIFESAGYSAVFVWEHELDSVNWQENLILKLEQAMLVA